MSAAKEAYPESLREIPSIILLPHDVGPLVKGSIVVLMYYSGADV
jgi:hypothetical protein